MSATNERRLTLRERIASMTKEELLAAARSTATADVTRKAAGLYEIVDDRAEAHAIVVERLPALEEVAAEIEKEQSSK